MRSKAEALTSAGEPRGDERSGLRLAGQAFEVEVVGFQAGSALSQRSSAVSVGQALKVGSEAGLGHAGLEGERHSEALVGIGALGDIDSSLASLGGEAESPAGLGSSALLLAVLEGGDALGVLLAGSPLGGALLLNALLRISKGDSGRDLFDDNLAEALLSLSALGDVDGGLAALGGKAEGPAGSSGSTLLLAVLNGRNAFRILLAGSPLVRALLLNTGEGIDGNFS
jgi:hypothetical protein